MVRTFIAKIKRQEPGIYSTLYRLAKAVRAFHLPAVRPWGALLYYGREVWIGGFTTVKAHLFWEQMLRFRCTVGRNVQLDGMPYVYGDGTVVIGDNVRIGTRNGWMVGLKVYPDAVLEIGDNTIVGYLNLFSVAQRITIGRYCVFAGEVKILDNNSHSLDFEQRRMNAPLVAAEVAPVVVEDDVWIGANCTVLKGVTVGRGSVVAAGAVVTRSVPPFTVVAGNPARAIKQIEPHFSREALRAAQAAASEQKDHEPVDVHAHSR